MVDSEDNCGAEAALSAVGGDVISAWVQSNGRDRPGKLVYAGLGVSGKHSKMQEGRDRTDHGA